MRCCRGQVEAWDVAIKSCDSVLLEEPENTKALFRKGKVRGSTYKSPISVIRTVTILEFRTIPELYSILDT